MTNGFVMRLKKRGFLYYQIRFEVLLCLHEKIAYIEKILIVFLLILGCTAVP